MCNTLNDEATGTCICLGVDGYGCGCELIEKKLYSSPQQMEYEDPYELFSGQQKFQSDWNFKGKKLSWMNTTIEKDMCRYGRDNVVTSDYYKDNQCKTVYELLD